MTTAHSCKRNMPPRTKCFAVHVAKCCKMYSSSAFEARHLTMTQKINGEQSEFSKGHLGLLLPPAELGEVGGCPSCTAFIDCGFSELGRCLRVNHLYKLRSNEKETTRNNEKPDRHVIKSASQDRLRHLWPHFPSSQRRCWMAASSKPEVCSTKILVSVSQFHYVHLQEIYKCYKCSWSNLCNINATTPGVFNETASSKTQQSGINKNQCFFFYGSASKVTMADALSISMPWRKKSLHQIHCFSSRLHHMRRKTYRKALGLEDLKGTKQTWLNLYPSIASP